VSDEATTHPHIIVLQDKALLFKLVANEKLARIGPPFINYARINIKLLV
jgi:hypothetical protein